MSYAEAELGGLGEGATLLSGVKCSMTEGCQTRICVQNWLGRGNARLKELSQLLGVRFEHAQNASMSWGNASFHLAFSTMISLCSSRFVSTCAVTAKPTRHQHA